MQLRWTELQNRRTGVKRRAPILVCSAADYSEISESCGGVCLACGEVAWGDVEPDARGYECGACGAAKVYGAEDAAMMGRIEIAPDDASDVPDVRGVEARGGE